MTLQIEEGKFYVDRSKNKQGPMAPYAAGSFTWAKIDTAVGSPKCWRDDGSYGSALNVEHPYDLIAEWVEPVNAREDGEFGEGATVLPDDNPKTRFGAAKPPLHAIPPVALLHLGAAMEDGEGKYGLFNWREHNVSSTIYYDAALRHLMAWWDGENVATDSGVHHLGHVMACCAILLDAEASGKLNDNRGRSGAFSKVVEKMKAERANRVDTAS